uniref:Fanconi-associated nuclease n=1 Tax=Salix viminalis TaxID=40686 RepID=A0A6N2MY43_SALVM
MFNKSCYNAIKTIMKLRTSLVHGKMFFMWLIYQELFTCMTKYQQTLWVLIQEVLKSNPHLFTNDEKIFLESFISLPDDSQRLFVRLYTRKGPWFRLSSISYPEVSDSRQAIKDLSAMGYMCSFKGVDELEENDMEQILNLLTVSELREIASMSKVCIGIIFSVVLGLILLPLLHKHCFLTRASGILCCVMW